jgi:hypothetical protein
MSYRYADRTLRACCLVVLGAAIACERSRGAAAASDSAKTAGAADTVVRYVVRARRFPLALERITPDLHVQRALAPLDTLVVRVYDNRAVKFAGVPVRWSAMGLGEGAQFNVVNARSDSLGLSRATFTPGTSADSQHVFADVEKVGRIDFTVVVPVTSLGVRVSQPDVWSGETVLASAELRDVAGRELTGGQLSWASDDTSVLRVERADATHGRVTGIAAGEASIVAWVDAGRVQGSARLLVRPVVAGAFVTLDGRPPPDMRMEIRSEAVRESLSVVDGRFTARPLLDPDASVQVLAAPVRDTLLYHTVDVRVHAQRDLQRLRVALIPTHWRIDAGTYAGRDIPVDAARALRRTGRGAGFWRLVPLSGTSPRRILGWAESQLPLRLAFDRAQSFEPITAGDSTAFWASADRMQRDLGVRVFIPANMNDTVRGPVVPIEISMQSTEGHTSLSWGQAGDAGDGVILLRSASTLGDAHVVTHELLHLLGFGHTSQWPTVSVPAGGTEIALTPFDVAYVQLAMRLRRLQHETGALHGLPLSAP